MKKNIFIKITLTVLVVFFCMIGCETTQQDGRLIEGLDFFAREEYTNSLKVFNEIIKENPENTSALYYRALTYGKVLEEQKSILDFQKVYELDNNFRMKPEQFFSFAVYNYKVKKDYKKAIDLYNVYIQKYPKGHDVIRAYIEIADSYSLQKDFDNAILSYKKVVEIYKNGKKSIEKSAVALAQDGANFLQENSDYDRRPLFLYADMKNTVDPLKKIEIGSKILEKYPNCNLADDVQFRIAKLYSVDGLNDFDRAQIEYQKVIDKYPNSKFVDYAKNSVMGINEKYDRKSGKLSGRVH